MACATAICSASAVRYSGASSSVSSTQTWLAPPAMAASQRSIPTLAVCHSATGSTRAGTPCTALSVRAARPSSPIILLPAPSLCSSSAASRPPACA